MFKILFHNDFLALWHNVMFNIFIKASIILSVPLFINLIRKRSAAEFRHLLLFISITILIILPVLPGPIITFEFSPSQSEWVNQSTLLSETSPTIANSNFEELNPTAAMVNILNPLVNFSDYLNLETNYTVANITFMIWLVGSVFLIAHLLTGLIGVYRIKKSMTLISDQEWVKTLANFCGDMKLNRTIQLLIGGKLQAPFTFGLFRPFIYLPSSFKNFSIEQRQCVLLHELSHIKRKDTLTYFIARFIVALYWFNPLAWLALRLLRLEQEKACDDRVLNYGIKPCDYAFLLLNFLKERRPAHPVAALGVSSFKTIKSRIGQILNPIHRHSLINTKMCITAMTIATILTLTVTAFVPGAIARDGSTSSNPKQVEHFRPEQPDNMNPSALKNDSNHETALTSKNTEVNTEPKSEASTVNASDIPSLMPINGNIRSYFGKRYHEKLKAEKLHSGIDIEAQIGTPVNATANGTVLKTEFNGGYGLMVKIAHKGEISTVYAHLSSISVKPAQIIQQGDILGYSGNTGRTTGPHLHYEILLKSQPVDPLIFINQDNTQAKPKTEKAPSQPEETSTITYSKFIKPVPLNKVSSSFGTRIDPITKTSRFHSGIDIPLPIGTPVKASADGQVIKADRSGGYGILIIIKHENEYSTYYAKLSQALVKEGDSVKQGDIIAYSGNTGRSTGPHLHFEIRGQDRPVDPMLFLPI